ncbi:hypothetical protein EOM82_03565 [bacterium]|nr:hypothetical protein [bacterium]
MKTMKTVKISIIAIICFLCLCFGGISIISVRYKAYTSASNMTLIDSRETTKYATKRQNFCANINE